MIPQFTLPVQLLSLTAYAFLVDLSISGKFVLDNFYLYVIIYLR